MSLYKKAVRLKEDVIYQGTSPQADYFEFPFEKNIFVHLKKDSGISFTCTCLFHSVKDVEFNSLCSYVMACINFMCKRGEANGNKIN